VTVPSRVSCAMAVLAAGMLLAVWVYDARPDPPPAPDSLRAGTDPAIIWSFDTGG